jgi:hypothetical protein
MFSERFIDMSFMYFQEAIVISIMIYSWTQPFGKKALRYINKKVNVLWAELINLIDIVRGWKYIFLTWTPQRLKTTVYLVYVVLRYMMKWATGLIFASVLAAGRPLRDIKNLTGEYFYKCYFARRNSVWHIITSVIALTLLIAIIWANHIVLSYLLEHGFSVFYSLLILISKKISLIFLKTLSKVVGFFFGEEIRENPTLTDWINLARAAIALEYEWYIEQFDDNTLKLVKLIYWPVQIWAWGTVFILGL